MISLYVFTSGFKVKGRSALGRNLWMCRFVTGSLTFVFLQWGKICLSGIYIAYMGSSQAISNSIAPQPRFFSSSVESLGRHAAQARWTSDEKILGFGAILLDIALEDPIYTLHIYIYIRVLQSSANKNPYNRVISTKFGETCFIFDSIRSGYNFGCVIVYLWKKKRHYLKMSPKCYRHKTTKKKISQQKTRLLVSRGVFMGSTPYPAPAHSRILDFFLFWKGPQLGPLRGPRAKINY